MCITIMVLSLIIILKNRLLVPFDLLRKINGISCDMWKCFGIFDNKFSIFEECAYGSYVTGSG